MSFYSEPKIEDTKDRLEVYDEVWILSNNNIVKRLVYSRREVMNLAKNGIDVEYRLVVERCGANDLSSVSTPREKIFNSKQALVQSL